MDTSSREFELFYQISQVASQDLAFSELLEQVVQLAAELMQAQICSVFLVDEQKGELPMAATQAKSMVYRRKPPMNLDKSISGRTIQTRQPQIVSDIQAEKDLAFREILQAEGLASMLSVPIVMSDKVLGALNCFWAEKKKFTPGDTKLLSLVAGQAAMIIQNARLQAANAAIQQHLETRKLVEKAKSVLMAQRGLPEAEAFRFIQKQSMDLRKPMRNIAEAILISAQVKV